MARINLLDLLPGGRRGVNTACAEAVWKHNVSVYRKNINTSSPLWVIDGGTGEGQPAAGRVTESQELARETDPMEMNLGGHQSGQVAPGTSSLPCASLPVLSPSCQPGPRTFPCTVTPWVGGEVERELPVVQGRSFRVWMYEMSHPQGDAESKAKLLLHIKISKAYFMFASLSVLNVWQCSLLCLAFPQFLLK